MFSLKTLQEKKTKKEKNRKEFTPGNLPSYTQFYISTSVEKFTKSLKILLKKRWQLFQKL